MATTIAKSDEAGTTTTNSTSDVAILGLRFFENCNSITKKALSLKTIVPFQDIYAALNQQVEISKWLDRQQLDYLHKNEIANNIPESLRVIPSDSFNDDAKMEFISDAAYTATASIDITKLQGELMERTSDQYLQHLLIQRIQMAMSAEAALCFSRANAHDIHDQDDVFIISKEALKSRDLVADQVTKLQNEGKKVREELETITRRARAAQAENRALWITLNVSSVSPIMAIHAAMTWSDRSIHPDADLLKQNQLLQFVLADLVVGTDHLYSDNRIAKLLLKLVDH